jgi:hypothetical protein
MGEVMMENIILDWNGEKISYFVDGAMGRNSR